MPTRTDSRKNTNWARMLIFVVVTGLVLAGVALGVNYLWQKRFGPTVALAADCRLAQQLFDQAQSPPTDPVKAEEWEQQIRKDRYAKFRNDGLSTQVGRYVYWARVKATGEGERPSAADFSRMKKTAIGHCDGSGVHLNIPDLKF